MIMMLIMMVNKKVTMLMSSTEWLLMEHLHLSSHAHDDHDHHHHDSDHDDDHHHHDSDHDDGDDYDGEQEGDHVNVFD